MRLRTTFEPHDEELIRLMKEDPIGRNSELGYLVRLLDASDDGLSVFLNGKWGCGKSYFVRQAELLLRALNPNLTSRYGLTDEDCVSIVGKNRMSAEDARQYLPVYFNAWKHDAFGEPVLSLVCDIADMEDITQDFEPNKEALKKIVLNIAKCVVKSKLPALKEYVDEGVSSIGELATILTKTADPLQEYQDRKNLEKHVNLLIDKALHLAGSKERPADAIVIFVDELDRCRPSYAIEVLESVKHLLVRPDVVVIFSVDAQQLAEVIRGTYGINYSAEHYLKRFYDVSLRLSRVDPDSFMTKTLKWPSEAHSELDLVARDLVADSEFVMRDIVQYYESVSRVRNLRYYAAYTLDSTIRDVVCPAICYLKIYNQLALDRLENRGEVDSAFLTHVTGSQIAGGILDKALDNMPTYRNDLRDSNPTKLRQTLMRDLLLAYAADEDLPLHKEALASLEQYNQDYKSRRVSIRAIQEQCSI